MRPQLLISFFTLAIGVTGQEKVVVCEAVDFFSQPILTKCIAMSSQNHTLRVNPATVVVGMHATGQTFRIQTHPWTTPVDRHPTMLQDVYFNASAARHYL
jgi:hypothetical protein